MFLFLGLCFFRRCFLCWFCGLLGRFCGFLSCSLFGGLFGGFCFFGGWFLGLCGLLFGSSLLFGGWFLGFGFLGLFGLFDLYELERTSDASSFRVFEYSCFETIFQCDFGSSVDRFGICSTKVVVGHDVLNDGLSRRALLVLQCSDGSSDHGGIRAMS